jgi:hypothetical protein
MIIKAVAVVAVVAFLGITVQLVRRSPQGMIVQKHDCISKVDYSKKKQWL